MTIEKMHSITKMLDLLGKTEHIFFMSKEEFDKEFDFVVGTHPKYTFVADPSVTFDDTVSTLIFDGIKFHIIDPDNLKSVVKHLPIAGAAIDIDPIVGMVV